MAKFGYKQDMQIKNLHSFIFLAIYWSLEVGYGIGN
jgi:hypothetical protein